MQNIIVGYDGSEESERAVRRGADIAEAFSSHLVVVSVTKPTPVTPALAELAPSPVVMPGAAGPVAVATVDRPTPTEVELEQVPSADELAERQLERARTTLSGRSIDAEFVSELGDTAERLLDVAEHRSSDLIVVGCRDHGFFERLFSRPVDETVARRADSDVLLVH
jgi:nucleotide-binding universal stress UspA family protein